MGTENNGNDLEALTIIISALKKLDAKAKRRVFESVATFLGIEKPGSLRDTYAPRASTSENRKVESSPVGVASFGEDRTQSPKDFLRDKQPRTDVDRVACLAYYLTHYRSKPHFKTLDISTLNTEAAQPKFSSASVAVDNATKLGYLATATKGNKQISATGEQFVQILPDRDAAKAQVLKMRPRRKNRKSTPRNNKR